MRVKYVKLPDPLTEGAGDRFTELLNKELVSLMDYKVFSVYFCPPVLTGLPPTSAFIVYDDELEISLLGQREEDQIGG